MILSPRQKLQRAYEVSPVERAYLLANLDDIRSGLWNRSYMTEKPHYEAYNSNKGVLDRVVDVAKSLIP